MKRVLFAALLCLVAGAAYAAQVTLTNEGAFDYGTRTNINSNFTELYGVAVNGTTAFTSTSSSTITRSPAADSALTNQTFRALLTAPIDTTGTNTHNAFDVGLTVSNATGGTNTVNGFKFDNYTGDAQVNVNAINIGTSDGLGTATAIKIGTGWGLDLNGSSGITESGTMTLTGAISVDGVTVNKKALSLPGRADFVICGDGTTINNNTIYYGPSMVIASSATVGTRTCNTTAAGNATEASAQAKALDNTAFQVLSMDCLTTDPGASGVSFTLRNSSAATVPSVTCSVANTKLGCTANIQTTTAIAAGNSIAVAAASAGDQGTTPFICTVHVAY